MMHSQASNILLLNQMKIINIGILAHIDAGKTSVTENLLFFSGAIEKCGSVDRGNTVSDSMNIEKQKGITVRASTTSIVWNNIKINIIDTPGHMDFIGEVERTFRILDGAILILSAKDGIQAQATLLFNILQQLKIPIIIFINKIDQIGINLNQLYSDIRMNFSKNIFVMQSVINESHYSLCPRKKISEEYKEVILDNDDYLLNKYLAEEEITEEEYRKAITTLISTAKAYPVIHGSAKYNIGIKELLDAAATFILPPVNVLKELSAYVYKIEQNKKEQKRVYLKIICGSLRIRSLVGINNSKEAIKIRNLKTIHSGKEIETNEVFENDIAIIDNVKELQTGDFLGTQPVLVQGLVNQTPALRSSIQPCHPEERSKLITALNILFTEDPSLSFSINPYNNDLEISLYGLTQKEVILAFLEERFSMKVYFNEVRTVYKEHPKRKIEKIINIGIPPNPYSASIGLIIEPLPIGTGLQIESNISLGYLNHSFQNAVFDGIKRACQSGLYGWEVTDLKVTFSYAFYFSPVSTPADFRQLAPYVFWLALQQCEVDILEPILQFKLQIPQSASSKAITDMQKMMANIENINSNRNWVTIEGKVPLDTSKEYASEISSYTHGLGAFITRPYGFQITQNKHSNNTNPEKKDKLLFMFEKSQN